MKRAAAAICGAIALAFVAPLFLPFCSPYHPAQPQNASANDAGEYLRLITVSARFAYCRWLSVTDRLWEMIIEDIEVVWVALTAVATAFIAYFTFALKRSTDLLGDISRRQAEHMQRAERAYVKMSHTPRGIAFREIEGDKMEIAVDICIKNFGRTPAQITAAFLKAIVVPMAKVLPETPDYAVDLTSQGGPIAAFLVADDDFIFYPRFIISKAVYDTIRNGVSKIVLYGYVDYIDELGKEAYRGGYGRYYKTIRDDLADSTGHKTATNLVFIGERGYNYDKSAKDDE